jgi:threonine aldolase
MPSIRIDFASDTITRPTPEMRRAMAEAPVGDDVFDEDRTIHALEARIAEMVGKEDAIYVPSGTMSNQIAIRLHCRPGDEFLCEEGCHINNHEQAAHVQLSGVCPRTLKGEYGVLRPDQFVGMIRPDNDHYVRTRLVCLENTHNRGAGRIQPYEYVEAICDWAHENGLATHLDGARLFNAVVAIGIPAADWARHFDTVSICFSKGLGAPVGSALCGHAKLIREARRHRKVLGGGMRQAGIIAAGALYALENHVERLAVDHANAQILAEGVRAAPGLSLDPDRVDTNIVFFQVSPELGTAKEFCAKLLTRGVRMLADAPTRVRALTHLDVSRSQVEEACEALHLVATDMAGTSAERMHAASIA